jgi:hypothetical protein
MADKKSILKGALKKAGSGIMKGANKVTDVVGARDLSNYAAGKMAKAMVPREARKYVQDDTSGKAALKSAGKLGLSIASVASAAGLARGVAKRAAVKAAGKAAVKRAGGVEGVKVAKTTGFEKLMRAPHDGRMKNIMRASKEVGKKVTSKFPSSKLSVTSQTPKTSMVPTAAQKAAKVAQTVSDPMKVVLKKYIPKETKKGNILKKAVSKAKKLKIKK